MSLAEAQSSLRKFKLKLKERELEKERLRKLRERHAAAMAQPASRPRAAAAEAEPIAVPTYVERRPGEIMRVIASQVGTDYTAPNYVFQDDPMLIPYTSMSKRDFSEAKAGGRRAARYIFDKHPELFTNNRIEMDPPIKKFMPTARFTKEGSNEELLRVYMEGDDLERAIKVYEAMVERGKEVSNGTKEELLQMLAYNNHAQPFSEDAKMVAAFQKSEPLPWESGCLAEKIYSAMDPITPAARVALLCGYASFRDSRRAENMAEECRANGIKLPLVAHNLLISSKYLGAGWEKSWGHVEKALQLMLEDGCRPDAGTIKAMLNFLFRAANRFGRGPTGAKALEVMAEARRCGISPTLGCYNLLSRIFGHESDIILDIMSEVENREWTVTHVEDPQFLRTAMECADKRDDLDLAYRVHKMALKESNRPLLEDFQFRYSYFGAFFRVVLKHESVDAAMESFFKLAPHFADVSYQVREAAVQKLKDEGGYQYVPQLWTYFVDSNFGGIFEKRYQLTAAFLDIIRHADLAKAGMEDLVPSYLQICRLSISVLEQYAADSDSLLGRGMSRQYPLSNNPYAVKICDDVIDFCLRHDDVKTAKTAMAFCSEHVAVLSDCLKDETVRSLADAMIEGVDKKAAIDCIVYAMQQSLDCADAIAADVAGNFELAEDEKSKLNKMFAHETRWSVLT